jgi:hypothetical protein
MEKEPGSIQNAPAPAPILGGAGAPLPTLGGSPLPPSGFGASPQLRKKPKLLRFAVTAIAVIVLCWVAFMVLVPALLMGGFFWQESQGIARQEEAEAVLAGLPASDVKLPERLVESDCVGLFGTEGFMDNGHPRLAPYVEKLALGDLEHVAECRTPEGTFVSKTSIGFDDKVTVLYRVQEDGSFSRLLDLDVVYEIADADGRVFALVPASRGGSKMSRDILVYEPSAGGFRRVVDTGDAVTVCSRQNAEQCVEWRLKNFPGEATAGYDGEQKAAAHAAKFPAEEKTPAQLACMAEFLKESDRSDPSRMMKNIKYPSDLAEEPLLSCVTDPAKKPFSFEIYSRDVLVTESVTYGVSSAYFGQSKDKVYGYYAYYPGFTVFSYGEDSVARAVFDGMVSGEYPVGQLAPSLDNTEAPWEKFAPKAALESISKEKINGLDVYTIVAGTRYKAFVRGNTLVVLRYDRHLNQAIGEEAASAIAEELTDAPPFVPKKLDVADVLPTPSLAVPAAAPSAPVIVAVNFPAVLYEADALGWKFRQDSVSHDGFCESEIYRVGLAAPLAEWGTSVECVDSPTMFAVIARDDEMGIAACADWTGYARHARGIVGTSCDFIDAPEPGEARP